MKVGLGAGLRRVVQPLKLGCFLRRDAAEVVQLTVDRRMEGRDGSRLGELQLRLQAPFFSVVENVVQLPVLVRRDVQRVWLSC